MTILVCLILDANGHRGWSETHRAERSNIEGLRHWRNVLQNAVPALIQEVPVQNFHGEQGSTSS